MNADEIALLANGAMLKSSLERYAPLNRPLDSLSFFENFARSITQVASYICTTSFTGDIEVPILHVFPNPKQGIININLPEAEIAHTVEVYNSLGQLVLESSVQADLVDLSSLQPGLYFLNLSTINGKSYTGSISVY